MKRLLTFLSAFILVSQAHGEQAIVFDDHEKVYRAFINLNLCNEENDMLKEMIDTKEKELETADKQISLLQAGNKLCTEYTKELESNIEDLKDILQSKEIYVDAMLAKSRLDKVKDHWLDISSGMILGFFLALLL